MCHAVFASIGPITAPAWLLKTALSSSGSNSPLATSPRSPPLSFVGADTEGEPIRAILDEQLGDEVVRQVLAELLFLRGDVRGLRGLLDLVVAVVKTLEILSARDDAVTNADDDGLNELRGGKRPGERNSSERDQCFFHRQLKPPRCNLY